MIARVLLPPGEGGPKGRMRVDLLPSLAASRLPLPEESVAKLGIRSLLSYELSCRRAIFPSLHHRKEGWLRHQENFAKPPKQTQPGWFSFLFSIGKPPRPRDQWMLRDIFLLARPPLLAVMQGGEYRSPATHPLFVRAP